MVGAAKMRMMMMYVCMYVATFACGQGYGLHGRIRFGLLSDSRSGVMDGIISSDKSLNQVG